MIRTKTTFLALLLSCLTFVSCGRGARHDLEEIEARKSNESAESLRGVDPDRLKPLTGVLRQLGLFPDRYLITHFPSKEHTKNKIFEEWFQDRLKNVDSRMHDEMLEWKYPEAKESRQEESGTLRNSIAARDTAENFTYAKNLEPEEIRKIAAAVGTLQATGIELAYNGFDLSGCNTDMQTRQMDDYVISPMLIDPKTGDLWEFHYRGGCRLN